MSKKQRKKRQHDAPQAERVRRQLEKGDAKNALKEAKRCFRADPSANHRSLLEEAYLGRVEQLHRMKQVSDAKTILAELLALKPTTQVVTDRLTRLKVMVGVGSADTDAVLRDDPLLLRELVDQAVLHEGACVPDFEEFPAQVAAVRDALVAVERGADDEAAERLAIIARNSPLADWRLFVRGLSAFYQQDDERTRNNWERLDPTRPGSRIARTLLAAAGTPAQEPAADLSSGIRRLELHTRSNAVIDLLKKIAAAWKRREWRMVFRHYRQLRMRFSDSHAALVRQVAEIISQRAVRESIHDALTEVVKIGPAPESDPRWNRAKAIFAEHPESDTSLDDIESAWVAYAEDLEHLPCLREDERPIAVGLVYQHLAREFVHCADDNDMDPFGFVDEAVQGELRLAAVRHYRNSIKACPRLQASFLELAELLEKIGETGQSVRTMEMLARQDPDCFEAVLWLAQHYLSQDDPGQSERYVEAARRLRPRDRQCLQLAWNQKLTMVRCLAMRRQFEAARQEIKQAAEIAPPDLEPFTLDLLRAGVEFKAKHMEAAQAFVQSALAMVEEPTVIWLQLSSIAAQMRVAREFKKDFNDRFKAGIELPPTSESAGRMARFLAAMKSSKVNYTGRATHEKLLIKYLYRAVTIAWKEYDLRCVCEFLVPIPRLNPLRVGFVQTGVEQFPRVPQYHYWSGMQEVNLGPRFCDLDRASKSLQQALDLHHASDIELTADQLEAARSALSMVLDFQEKRPAFAAGSPSYVRDDDDEDDGYDDGYDDDDDGFPAGQDEAAFAAMVKGLPPKMRIALEETARRMGVDASEILRGMMGTMERGSVEEAGETGRPRVQEKSR